jgi:hypothetical protein
MWRWWHKVGLDLGSAWAEWAAIDAVDWGSTGVHGGRGRGEGGRAPVRVPTPAPPHMPDPATSTAEPRDGAHGPSLIPPASAPLPPHSSARHAQVGV